MAQPERQIGQQENESLWKSNFVKAAIVLAVAGVAFGVTLHLINS